MKKHRIVSLAAALALLLTACGQTEAPSGASAAPTAAPTASAYQKVTAEEAKTLLDGGEVAVLVDVRTAEEYEEAHIPGAVNIPNESIGGELPEGLPDLDAALMVYCRTGVRSKAAADKLVELGYTNVRDMGGIADWTYDTVSGAEPDVYPVVGILSSFSAADLDGAAVDQTSLEGYDLIMVNVWATYCTPCIQEMPELGELAAEYADRGVRVLGMVSDVLNYDGSVSESQLATARDIVAATGADYTHLVPSGDLLGLLSQITAVPTTFFVDSRGVQVGTAYLGARDKDGWAAILDGLLEEVAA